MSESGSGSDVVSMRCRADKQDGCYVLNGTKMWCTNGTVANTLVVYARTEQEQGPHGITAFVIEKGMKVPHVTTHTHDECYVVAAFCACVLQCPPLLNRLQQDLNLVHLLHKKFSATMQAVFLVTLLHKTHHIKQVGQLCMQVCSVDTSCQLIT